MVEVREEVVEQLEAHQETMRLEDFVRIVERDHRGDGAGVDRENGSGVDRENEAGVDRETLTAYAEAVYFDVDRSAIDERVIDSNEWAEGEHFYEVGDGRVSVYPPDWHEAFADTSDVRDVLEVIQRETTEPEGDAKEAVTEEQGVPEEKLFWVAETVADIDRETVRERLKQLRQEGEIEEFASQHRNPTIRIS